MPNSSDASDFNKLEKLDFRQIGQLELEIYSKTSEQL